MQYDLFQDDDVETLLIEIENLKKTQSSMRRALFARYNELERTMMQIQREIEAYKQIVSGKKADLVPFFGEYIEVSN
ncbi:MAG: hypothetical protein EHM34_05380 [Nitrosopumilales archaeon]|nr:MAG: hypothetical protein EHM34_05380 [Nitrosopumilales archaeon]